MIVVVVLGVAGVVALAVGGALGYRALCQRRAARALMISSPAGIVEDGYVRIGGIDQWIQIRGQDRANPALLFLHGAGMTMTPFTSVLRHWEEHFTVVQWDRRGVGRTLARNGTADRDRLTFDLLAADGVEVAEHVRRRLGVGKVIVLGHSQGTIVGVLMAQRRPDLFSAYVGTGQITDMARNEAQSYQLAVRRADAAGHARAARELAKIGAPPYPSARTWLVKQRRSFDTDSELRAWGKTSMPMVLTAPRRSLRDVYLFAAAFSSYPQPLYEETMAWDAAKCGTNFTVPFFLFHGDADQQTLTSLVAAYFAGIDAPVKDLALIPGGGHCAVLIQPGAILAYLRAKVAPLATAPTTLS